MPDPEGSERPAEKRKLQRRTVPITQLVVDPFVGSRAVQLCESSTSRSPDFANTKEHLFCDMSEKKVCHFCNNPSARPATEEPCFDLDTQQLARGGIVKRASPHTAVLDWRVRSGRDKPEVNLTR